MRRLVDLDLGIAKAAGREEPRVSAVVLAAGQSSRMGGQMKLLLDVDGIPMIRRTVGNVLLIDPVETVVVTGHRGDEVANAVAGLPIRIVHNPVHEQGQPTSVSAGVRALKEYCDLVMIVLGDQPLVGPADLEALVAAYRSLERGSILVPHHRGRRGNPVLFAARHVPAILSGGLNVGCRKLIETHPEEVAKVEFETDIFTVDCDTPDDYERLRRRAEETVLWPAQS